MQMAYTDRIILIAILVYGIFAMGLWIGYRVGKSRVRRPRG